MGLPAPAAAQTAPSGPTQDLSWRRFLRNVGEDQKGIWLSPFHADRRDAKWWALFGSATAALMATDNWTSKQLPNTSDQVRVGLILSRFGATYSIAPAMLAIYVTGAVRKDERLRETGLIGGEALANALLVSGGIKLATRRDRPLDGNGSGNFWKSGASFPSGHSTQIWAVASVVAHEYPRPRAIPVVAYGLATTVMVSRFTAQKHFASDVVAGAALGWFIGDYIFHRRHNRRLDAPRQ